MAAVPYLVMNLAYGHGSWGDEMILDGVLNQLGRELCVVHSKDPAETREMHQVRAISWGEKLPEYECLFIGGSGWGYEEHATHLVSRIQQEQESGHKIVVWAAGLRDARWEKHRSVLRRVDTFTVRDKESYDIAVTRLGVHTSVVDDPSLSMEVTPMTLPKARYVGINLLNTTAAAEFFVPIVQGLSEEGYTLLALPTIAHKTAHELDGHAAIKKLSDKAHVAIHDIPGRWHKQSLGPRELAGLAEKCEAILAMRKHGCWLAKRVGVPVVMFDCPEDSGIPNRLLPIKDIITKRVYVCINM